MEEEVVAESKKALSRLFYHAEKGGGKNLMIHVE